MFDQRNLRLWGFTAIGLVGGIVLAVAPILMLGRHINQSPVDPTRIVVITLAATLAIAWGALFATFGFRSADEFVREGSRVAWYWGGLLGLAASLPVYAFIAIGGLHWLWPASPLGAELYRAFTMGYLLPVITQAVGVLIASTWWRLSKR